MSHEIDGLFNRPREELTVDETKATLEVYKLLVDMADKVSQRRQNANNFYLSVNSAIVGVSAYISSAANSATSVVLLSVAGAAVSLLWARNIQSYRDLNSGKFAVINEIEKVLPVAPFKTEWRVLERGMNAIGHRPFHTVEILVPLVFVAAHAVRLIGNVPWAMLMSFVGTMG